MWSALAPAAFMARLLGRDGGVASTPPRITHRFALRVPGGTTRELPRSRGVLTVHCCSGSAWITHDGDPRDIVLQADQSYRVDRRTRLTAHAMSGVCVLELQVDPVR